MTLAKGDRRDYVVVDERGGTHALGKRILGCTAAETRAHLGDLDRDGLPSIEEARHLQRNREEIREQPLVQAGGLAWEDALTNAAIPKETVEYHFVASELAAEPPRLDGEVAVQHESADICLTPDRNEMPAGELAFSLPGAVEAAPAEVMGIASELTAGIGDGLNILGRLASIFGGNQPAPPQSKEEAQARKEASVNRRADLQRMLTDRAYRREIEQQERERRDQGNERAESERRRDRERY